MRVTNCMICDKPNPSGHIIVYVNSIAFSGESERDKVAGVICSDHTIWEIISHPSDRFYVDVTADEETGE